MLFCQIPQHATTTSEVIQIETSTESDSVFDISETISDRYWSENERCGNKGSTAEQAECLWDATIVLSVQIEQLIEDNSDYINADAMLKAGQDMVARGPEADDAPDLPEGFFSWTAARMMSTEVWQRVCYHACRLWKDFQVPSWANLDTLSEPYCTYIYSLPSSSSAAEREECSSFAEQFRSFYNSMIGAIAETRNWNTQIIAGGRCQITFTLTLNHCLNNSAQCGSTAAECRSMQESGNAQRRTDIHMTAEPAGAYTCFVTIAATLP